MQAVILPALRVGQGIAKRTQEQQPKQALYGLPINFKRKLSARRQARENILPRENTETVYH